MTRIRIGGCVDTDTDPFDRQKRIDWWRQDALASARVMVVGAGAIGNETLKNLALLGVGNIFIADFDEIARSNLSRTVLFRSGDVGQRKAEVAARRTIDLSPVAARVESYTGDVVWTLGVGVFRQFDIVLGCVDNVETRFRLNRMCWLAETPWIDTGIDSLAGHVAVYVPGVSACYECGASPQQALAARVRYSCDDFKRTLVQLQLVPTVQVSAAIAAAIQVQEAVKFLCGRATAAGKKLVFNGTLNSFDTFGLPANPKCDAHAVYTVTSAPLSSSTTVKELLEYAVPILGPRPFLDLSAEHFKYVESARCRLCGGVIMLNRPNFRINDYEAACARCRRGSAQQPREADDLPTMMTAVSRVSLRSGSQLLARSLGSLGVPYGHVLAVSSEDESEVAFLELSRDLPPLLKTLGTRDRKEAGSDH